MMSRREPMVMSSGVRLPFLVWCISAARSGRGQVVDTDDDDAVDADGALAVRRCAVRRRVASNTWLALPQCHQSMRCELAKMLRALTSPLRVGWSWAPMKGWVVANHLRRHRPLHVNSISLWCLNFARCAGTLARCATIIFVRSLVSVQLLFHAC